MTARLGWAARRAMSLGVLAAVVVPAAACGTSSAPDRRVPAAATFTNPVWPGNFPDPGLLRAGGRWYAYGTNGPAGNIPMLRSPDLVHWRTAGDALPHLGGWADPGSTWAPEVAATGASYVLYYTAHDRASGRECVGRATAATPRGPFVDRWARPLVCQADLGGSIDPDPFADTTGARYLYWKNDGNCCGRPVHLWGQRLSGDGTRLTGAPSPLLTNTEPWQGTLIEAPEMVLHAGTHYLF